MKITVNTLLHESLRPHHQALQIHIHKQRNLIKKEHIKTTSTNHYITLKSKSLKRCLCSCLSEFVAMTTLVRNTTASISRRYRYELIGLQGKDKLKSISYRRKRAKQRKIFLTTYTLSSLNGFVEPKKPKLKRVAVKVKKIVSSVLMFMRTGSCSRSCNSRSAISAKSPERKKSFWFVFDDLFSLLTMFFFAIDSVFSSLWGLRRPIRKQFYYYLYGEWWELGDDYQLFCT